MNTAVTQHVRVRMAPSPTGSPHVGLVRTALYNWAFARHHGGTFVFRIEDTDTSRNTKESYDALLDLFHWLGLGWDEGPEVGGDHGPYLQSERGHLYEQALTLLNDAGYTYGCYCTNDEVEERRKASGSKIMGYDRHCRDLTDDQVAAYEAEGRGAVLRFKMPDGEIAFDDLVRGRVSFHSDHVPDYALARANGDPLYTLVNPVDDALMEITHVLRGEDLLSSTPRQIPLYAALAEVGIGTGAPEFGHLPYVMGQGNKKLSKRDPEANALGYREAGFLPEGLLNYLALLGWAISGDRDIFTLEEMVDGVRHRRRQPQPRALRPEEGRRHQRLPHAAAEHRGHDPPGAAVPQGRGRRQRSGLRLRRPAPRAGHAAGLRADQQADRGRRHARVPLRRRGVVHPRPRRRREAARRAGAHHRAGVVRRRGGAAPRGRPARSRRPCRPSWSTSSSSSRGWRSGRCGLRSPGAACRRRCSSRWSSSAATGAWPASGPRWHERAGVPPDPPRWPVGGQRLVARAGRAGVPGRARAAGAGRGAGRPHGRLLRPGPEHGPGRGQAHRRSGDPRLPARGQPGLGTGHPRRLAAAAHAARAAAGLARLGAAADPLALVRGVPRAVAGRPGRDDRGLAGDPRAGRRRHVGQPQRVHVHRARLPAGRGAAHAAAGRGGGVRLPWLPHPGDRRLLRLAAAQRRAGGRGARRCCSRWRTVRRTRRSSSTGSRSGSSPAYW